MRDDVCREIYQEQKEDIQPHWAAKYNIRDPPVLNAVIQSLEKPIALP